eukprot:502754_1
MWMHLHDRTLKLWIYCSSYRMLNWRNSVLQWDTWYVKIKNAIEAYFVAKSHAHDDNDDGKDDIKEEYDDNAEVNKPIKRVDNAFVMFLGFAKYTIASYYKNLNDIHLDERCLRKPFVDQFGYRFESNEYKEKAWTKAKGFRWIRS